MHAFTPGCQYFREPAGRAGLSAASAGAVCGLYAPTRALEFRPSARRAAGRRIGAL